MAAVKNLRALSRREASPEDMAEFARQVNSESNDRGAVLLLTTNLDLALRAAINLVIHVDSSIEDRLDADGGPLSSFSQCIVMGRALRIFGPETHHNLDHVRHIRNAFAHAHVPITFETLEVQEVVKLLRPMVVMRPHKVSKASAFDFTPRGIFNEACSTLTHNLIVWTWNGRAHVNAPKEVLPPDMCAFVQKNPLL